MPEFKSKYLSSCIWGVNWDDGIFFGKKKKLTKMIVLKKAIFERIMWMKKKTKNYNKPMLDGQHSRQYEDLLPKNFLRDAYKYFPELLFDLENSTYVVSSSFQKLSKTKQEHQNFGPQFPNFCPFWPNIFHIKMKLSWSNTKIRRSRLDSPQLLLEWYF